VSSRASKCTDAGRVGTESSQAPSAEYELRDVVEPALARALVLAAQAQRWDVVLLIAAELEARRESRERGHASRPETVGPAKPRGKLSEMHDAAWQLFPRAARERSP
jgi:hypothetical protein